MNILAIVEIPVLIENFKSMNMLVFTLNPHLERDGGCLRAKRYIEETLSCNILGKYFRLKVKKERLGSNNIVVQPAPIS